MKQKYCHRSFAYLMVCLLLPAFISLKAMGQQNIIINLAPIDGIPITPENVFNYQVHASIATQAVITGTIRYRSSNLFLSYTLHCSLRQGFNQIKDDASQAQWQFSSPALQELFMSYKVLPEGTYEYCVTVTPGKTPKESGNGSFDECLYHRSEESFLINLIDPENNAKLKEFNPVLTWIANYSFSSELTYRLRIAAIKQGQNPTSAVMSNQPMFDESNLMQNSIVYPVYAKPLVVNQPYAWTVDAFYHGILLGGSETWQFIIPGDTLPPVIPANRSYIDIKKENGTGKLYIQEKLKIKYVSDNSKNDLLTLQLFNDKGEKVGIKPDKLNVSYGDNRYILNIKDSCNLKDNQDYILNVITNKGEHFKVPFKYLNSEFSH